MREERGKPDFVLTINFGGKTYEASVRGCQKHLQYFWLDFEINPFKQIRTGNIIFVHFRGKEVYKVQGYRTSLSPLGNKIFFSFCH